MVADGGDGLQYGL